MSTVSEREARELDPDTDEAREIAMRTSFDLTQNDMQFDWEYHPA